MRDWHERKDGIMTLQQLRYLIAVAEKGSITEAAKSLFISQPSLSNAIREVEQSIGFRIFNRHRTGVTLTAKGVEFLGHARQVV
ncbi:LysR family transcriptional regulator [Bifidobacterium angulatum]|uniref:LysR family transcriptional regulator n=1 Tax=Bifidobacterium angulatum TaxID=1683 RepID=UPI00406D35B0